MRTWVAAAVLVCAVCVVALPARAAPAWLDTTALVAAEASLAVDMLQTLDIKRHPDRTFQYYGTTLVQPGMTETNPILGEHPSDAKVCAYFAGTMLLTGAAWYALPPRLRFLAPLAALILEVPQIGRNAGAGLSIRL